MGETNLNERSIGFGFASSKTSRVRDATTASRVLEGPAKQTTCHLGPDRDRRTVVARTPWPPGGDRVAASAPPSGEPAGQPQLFVVTFATGNWMLPLPPPTSTLM
jgi:hypothetical protein